QPFGVEVDGTLADGRLEEGHVAGVRGERIGHRIGLWRRAADALLSETRPRRAGETIQIETESERGEAAVVDDSLQLLLVAVVDGSCLVGSATASEVRLGYTSECVQFAVVVESVRAGGRIVIGLEHLEHPLVRLTGKMVDLEDHALGHHLFDEELAEIGQTGILTVVLDSRQRRDEKEWQ